MPEQCTTIARRRGAARFVLLALLLLPLLAAAAGGRPDGPAATPGEGFGSAAVLLAIYVLLALVVSFLCSVAEAVLLSVTPSFIAGLKERDPVLAARLKDLKQTRVDQSLAAILTLNTIAHTVGAIGAGAQATTVFGSAWFGLFSAVMTLLILFLSEIVPKTIGAVYWSSLVRPVSVFVRGLVVSLYPLIWISERLTRLIARGRDVHVFNRDEFVAMAGVGERSGQLDANESRIIRNLFKLGALSAADVMTPRTVIQALPLQGSVDQALERVAGSPFSRLPVYGDDLDDIRGFVLKDELLAHKAAGEGERPAEELVRRIAAVPASMGLTRLLEFLLDHRHQIVLVVDEYGGTLGLVTLEDAVETLLGMEIVDELDQVPDMQALARRQWRKRAERLGMAGDDVDADEPGRGG